ncbi:MAG: YbjN domain-containing protein, partial [Planctomycetaceae bacterium]|nr:YbjN domain-containing protein [Planctomycetaceae bacterium]
MDALTDEQMQSLLSDLEISAVGRKRLEKGETLFTLEAHNRQVGVVHNAKYKQLQFVALFGDEQDVAIEKVRQANRWNRTQRLSRAVVLDGGTWAIARDVNYRHSASRESIGSALRQFVATLPSFRKFIEDGNEPETDHTRGPRGSVPPERVEQALQQAGAESVDLIEAKGDILTSFARFGTIAVTVTHDQRASILSLRYSYRAESQSLDEVLRRCNAWNDEPSLGRASSIETSAAGTAHALWQLDDDLALTMETTQPVIEGFVHEFISIARTFRQFAQDDQLSPPELAARFEPG